MCAFGLDSARAENSFAARFKLVQMDDPSALPPADLKVYLTEAHALIAAKLPKKQKAALGLG